MHSRATDQRQPSDQQPASTIAEIDDRIATDRLRYVTAFFAGDEHEAQYWVHEIARLENLRNIVQRQGLAS
jgi:L-lactate utilization protein LutB